MKWYEICIEKNQYFENVGYETSFWKLKGRCMWFPNKIFTDCMKRNRLKISQVIYSRLKWDKMDRRRFVKLYRKISLEKNLLWERVSKKLVRINLYKIWNEILEISTEDLRTGKSVLYSPFYTTYTHTSTRIHIHTQYESNVLVRAFF